MSYQNKNYIVIIIIIHGTRVWDSPWLEAEMKTVYHEGLSRSDITCKLFHASHVM